MTTLPPSQGRKLKRGLKTRKPREARAPAGLSLQFAVSESVTNVAESVDAARAPRRRNFRRPGALWPPVGKEYRLRASADMHEGNAMADVTRREFFKITGATLAGSSLALLGFSPSAALAEVREFKLTRATETRNTCPYCAVACGVIMYSLGDRAKNARSSIFHIEGDPDHPVNRGTLCPKGAGLLDFIHSPSRLTQPQYRAPGSGDWQAISWDDALDRIAKLMKADRDANFVAKNADGLTVNRWLTTGMLAASASSNEVGYLTHKVIRSLGILSFDNQARV